MNDRTLNDLLRDASRWHRLGRIVRGGCEVTGAILLLGLVAIAVDALFALPPTVRVVMALSLVLSVGASITMGVVIAVNPRKNPRKTARMLEDSAAIADNTLINAIDFSQGRATPMNSTLIAATTAHTQRLATTTNARLLFDPQRIRRALRTLVVPGTLVLLSLIAAPGVFRAVVPRFLQPLTDHPPYSLLTFTVEINPSRPVTGNPVVIHAKVESPFGSPSIAQVVIVDDANNDEPIHEDRIPMFRDVASLDTEQHDGREEHFTLRMDEAGESLEFYIDTPKGRSRRYPLIVTPVPRFERVEVHYDEPAYAQRADRQAVLEQNGDTTIAALNSAWVTLTIQSNVALRSGDITLISDVMTNDENDESDAAKQFELKPDGDDPRVVTGRFMLDRTGRYELSLMGAQGVTNEAPFEGRLIAQADRRPDVTLQEPGMDVIAPPHWRLPLVIEATDDLCVDRVVLHIRHGDQPAIAYELPLQGRTSTNVRATHTIDLGALGAQPGDRVVYHATAFDNHPSGQQLDESSIATIHIVDEEAFLELARQRNRLSDIKAEHEALAQEIKNVDALRASLLEDLRDLKDRIAGGEQDEATAQHEPGALKEKLGELARRADALAEQLRQQSDRLPLYAFDEAYAKALADMAEQLAQQAAQNQALSENAPSPGVSPLPWLDETEQAMTQQAQAGQSMDEAMAEIEQDVEQLRLTRTMIALGNAITQLTTVQRQLADSLAAHAHMRDETKDEANAVADDETSPPDSPPTTTTKPDRTKLRDLAQQQIVTRDALVDVVTRLEAAATAADSLLPDMARDAMKIVGDVRRLEILDDQANAAAHARNDEPDAAESAAEAAGTAANKLESMHAEMESAPSSASSSSQSSKPELRLTRQSMNQMNQMNQMMQQSQGPTQGDQSSATDASDAQSASMGMGVGMTNAKGQSAGGAGTLGVVGLPDLGMPGLADRPGGRSEGEGEGPGGHATAGQGVGDARPAESLATETDPQRRSATGATLAVPARFRDDAQAYFKRLAEDQIR